MTTASGDRRGLDSRSPAAARGWMAQAADRQGGPSSATAVVVLDASSGEQGRAAAGIPHACVHVADATLRVYVALKPGVRARPNVDT